MFSRKFSVQAVVVGRRNFKETDKFIDLITEKFGKITALAKGVRKINSKRLGSLELANFVKLLLYQGKTFAIITEVDILDWELSFRQDQAKLGCMMYVCELANRLIPEQQENKQAYHRLLTVRVSIKNSQLDDVVQFEADLLQILGYGVKSSTKQLLKNSRLKSAHQQLKNRIEEIIEQPLKSLEIFN